MARGRHLPWDKDIFSLACQGKLDSLGLSPKESCSWTAGAMALQVTATCCSQWSSQPTAMLRQIVVGRYNVRQEMDALCLGEEVVSKGRSGWCLCWEHAVPQAYNIYLVSFLWDVPVKPKKAETFISAFVGSILVVDAVKQAESPIQISFSSHHVRGSSSLAEGLF